MKKLTKKIEQFFRNNEKGSILWLLYRVYEIGVYVVKFIGRSLSNFVDRQEKRLEKEQNDRKYQE